jgi:broad specificity phosphatase PhoE
MRRSEEELSHLLIVRHAKARSRSRWEGDDRLRPLTKSGRAQAAGLASVLAPFGPRRVLSSPFVRCIETVEPLASALGLVPEEDEALAEGSIDAAVERVRSLAGEPVALCTHGDVVPAVLDALRDALVIPGVPRWEKGSTWVLEANEKGEFLSASYIPPPEGP